MMFAEDNLEKRKEQGVFSKVLIPANTIILEFKGDIVSKADIPLDLKPENDYYLQIGPNKYLTASGWLDDYISHSCNCNTKIRIVGNRAFLISLYQILPGHQITFDYSTTVPGNENIISECYCGDYHCRKIISGYNSLPDASKKYYEELDAVPDYVKENA